MEKDNFDDIFLARWISGELSPDELSVFEKSKYYLDYKKINEGAQAFKSPSFDREKTLLKLQKSLRDKDSNVKKLIPNWLYSVAAVLIIALGILYFYPFNTAYETKPGESLIVSLPDNSKVYLNANSTLEFKKNDWENNRLLTFNGEAFFDVEKGETFKVSSKLGYIEVLGTEFNVISRKNFFEIKCNEGKVKVSSVDKKELAVLTAGKAYRLYKNEQETWDFSEEKPTWINGESTFNNTPLDQVIKSLEGQYNIIINNKALDLNKRYTGSFTHDDLNLALKTVFKPLNIRYSQVENNTIILESIK